MEKLIYLAWKKPELDGAAYGRRLLEDVAPRLLAAGARRLDVNLSDLLGTIPKPMLLMGEGATLSAAVALWLDCYDARGPVEAALRSDAARARRLSGDRIGAAAVRRPRLARRRAQPRRHALHLVREAGGGDRRELLPRLARGAHAVLVRAAPAPLVLRAQQRGADPHAGLAAVRAIVVERFRALEDYTDPKRLFGSKEALVRSGAEVAQYADPTRLHSAPLSEFILRS